MPTIRIFILLLSALWVSCSGPEENRLRVQVEEIALRQAPGLKSATLGVLRSNEVLTDLGEVGAFETAISFGGKKLVRPWIKVRDKSGREGWVFAGAVEPEGQEPGRWLEDKRTDTYFGHPLRVRLQTWKNELDTWRGAAEFAEIFRSGMHLRDTLGMLLARRSEPGEAPDENWLAGLLPGFILQRSVDGGAPHFFADYRFWLQQARKSGEPDDDLFIDCCVAAFPADGIESPFPCWVFQLDETNAASRLGAGQHRAFFDRIDRTRTQTRRFDPELLQWKDALLEDILSKNTRYWLAQPAILSEMDDLIARPPACLSAQESSALALRRVMLETPEKHGIVVDLRSGGAGSE